MTGSAIVLAIAIVCAGVFILGVAVAVIAGTIAVMRHGPGSAASNAKRYVAPAMAGVIAAALAFAVLLITLIVAAVLAMTGALT